MTTISFILFFAAGLCAGDGHGSVKDLLWPSLNVGILFAFLGILLGKKGNAWFAAQAASVRQIYEYATQKDLKAQNNLDNLQKKLDNLPSELEEMAQRAKGQSEKWREEQKKQTAIYLEQMRKDVQDRIGYEKKTMVDQINNFLAIEVVDKVKDEIKKDPKWGKQIHRNLMEKLDIS